MRTNLQNVKIALLKYFLNELQRFKLKIIDEDEESDDLEDKELKKLSILLTSLIFKLG